MRSAYEVSFRSKRYAKALRRLGIKHKRTKPNRPRADCTQSDSDCVQSKTGKPQVMLRVASQPPCAQGPAPRPKPPHTNAAMPSHPSRSTTTPIAPTSDSKAKPPFRGFSATTCRDMKANVPSLTLPNC